MAARIKKAPLAISTALYILLTSNAVANDLFADGKATVSSTVGTDSSVEFYVWVSGFIGAVLFGFSQRNWISALTGFGIGMIFWEVGKGMVGLG